MDSADTFFGRISNSEVKSLAPITKKQTGQYIKICILWPCPEEGTIYNGQWNLSPLIVIKDSFDVFLAKIASANYILSVCPAYSILEWKTTFSLSGWWCLKFWISAIRGYALLGLEEDLNLRSIFLYHTLDKLLIFCVFQLPFQQMDKIITLIWQWYCEIKT